MRIVIAGTVAAVAATVLTLGGTLAEGRGAPREPVGAVAASADPAAATKASVAALQRRARANGDDADALTALGLAYLQRNRETGDPAYLAKADGVLRRARALKPRSARALTGLGALALSRHDFRTALRLGQRALRLRPHEAAARGVVGDALVELGRHDEAFGVFDRLAAEEPGAAAYARVSYGRQLLGRTEAAVAAMTLAATSAGGSREGGAWARVQLAEIELGRGRVASAERHLRLALGAFPAYPAALEARARVEARRGSLGEAVTLARRAVTAAPSPGFASTLADLHERTGNRRGAREQPALVDALAGLLRANGVRADLEIARFDADRGVRLRRAVVLARTAHTEAPSIQAADVLAWTLARSGRCRDARSLSDEALRLGTRDASMWFHRGMIERCLGNDGEARTWFRRAVALDPGFSLRWAPVAEEYAR